MVLDLDIDRWMELENSQDQKETDSDLHSFESLLKLAENEAKLDAFSYSSSAIWSPEIRPLSSLESEHTEKREKLQQTESSRDVYLSIWRSAPYFVLTLIVATLYLYASGTDLSFVTFSLMVSILTVAFVSWTMSRKRDSEIARLRIDATEIEGLISERIAQVKAIFWNYKSQLPGFFLTINNHRFSGEFDEKILMNYKNYIGPRRLRDMNSKHHELVMMIAMLGWFANEYFKDTIRFYEAVDSELSRIDKGPSIKENDKTDDRREKIVRGLYKVVSGNVRSIMRVKESQDSSPDPDYHYVEMFLLPEDEKNPLPRLARNPEMTRIGENAEQKRKACVRLYNELISTTDYLFGKS